MKISVITPSVRPEMLHIVDRCLRRQTFQDFEQIVVGPEKDLGILKEKFTERDGEWRGKIKLGDREIYLCVDPPKRDGDYYRLNGAWNEAIRQSRGELFVSIVDGIWFPPDTLERLWSHYEANPKACITTIGHQYKTVVSGKPEGLVWKDPRARADFGSFYEVSPREMELCIASLPMGAVKEVGGFDEEYDKYAALSEKELCYRLDALGYKFFIDQTIEYRAIHHPRLSESWDEHYFKGWEYHEKCLREILEGKRLKLNFLA